jgi:hypothetical protein
MQTTTDPFISILFIILAAMGVFALLLTMGYMIYGEEDEE